MTTTEAAQRLGISSATVRNYVRSQLLRAIVKHYPTGRQRIDVTEDSVVELEERMRQQRGGLVEDTQQ